MMSSAASNGPLRHLDGYGSPPIADRITPTTVFAFGTAEPYGATKFDLSR